MNIKVTYDTDKIPINAEAQIEYYSKNFIKIETLYSIEQLDEAMGFFRRMTKKLEKLHNRFVEEKGFSDTKIEIGKNTISVSIERNNYDL